MNTRKRKLTCSRRGAQGKGQCLHRSIPRLESQRNLNLFSPKYQKEAKKWITFYEAFRVVPLFAGERIVILRLFCVEAVG